MDIRRASKRVGKNGERAVGEDVEVPEEESDGTGMVIRVVLVVEVLYGLGVSPSSEGEGLRLVADIVVVVFGCCRCL
jgi:hypothetical protein